MRTKVKTEKMIVISDLHLGNPSCERKQEVIRFLHEILDKGYDLCINGDVFEIAQVSFNKLAVDVPDFLQTLRRFGQKKQRVYYVIGNHDIALENFFADWGQLEIIPFLNAESNGNNIRIEHGHLYDPFFVNYPRLYEILTSVAGIFLNFFPKLYGLWIFLEKSVYAKRSASEQRIPGEPSNFPDAAYELARRGFDTVIFGHTHKAGKVEIMPGKWYLNSGSWMTGTWYIEIDNGMVNLKNWIP